MNFNFALCNFHIFIRVEIFLIEKFSDTIIQYGNGVLLFLLIQIIIIINKYTVSLSGLISLLFIFCTCILNN